MILRGFVAILAGLTIGVLTGLVLIAAKSGGVLDVSNPVGIVFMVGAGIVVTAPGWVLSSAVVLTIVTHRARRIGLLDPIPYFALAAATGAVAVLPTFLFLAAPDPSVLFVMVPSGVAGGAAIAAMWRLWILKPIAARRASAHGAYLG